MPFSIKTKQVAAVTLIVGLAVILVSLWYASSLVNVWLGEAKARAELIADMVSHRITGVGNEASAQTDQTSEPLEVRVERSLAADPGLHDIVEGSLFSDNVIYAAIVDTEGKVIVHSTPGLNGSYMRDPVENIETLLAEGPIAQARAIYTRYGKSYEYRSTPLLLGKPPREFATVRVGISTLFLRSELEQQMRTPLITSVVAMGIALFVAVLLAQLTL